MKTIYEAYNEACRGINIKENEKIVLECKNIHMCYKFALDVPGANIEAHEKIIIENKSPMYCYFFAKYAKNSNKEELFKVILEFGELVHIRMYLENINFDKEKYINYLLFI